MVNISESPPPYVLYCILVRQVEVFLNAEKTLLFDALVE